MPERAPGVLIRPARPRDASAFVEAYRDVAAERRFLQTEVVTRSVRSYRRRFRASYDGEGAHLLAFEGGRLIGSLSIRRDDQPATRHVATLGMFGVGDRRDRGVGTELMREALRWARDHGVERIELTVFAHNGAAIALYRRFGFEQEGRLVRHAKKSYGYEDEILMAVWIGPEPEGGPGASGSEREGSSSGPEGDGAERL